MSLYDDLAERVRRHIPVALATVVEGATAGRKLLVSPGAQKRGSLGHVDLDRAVVRDVEGELTASCTRLRRYGSRGQSDRADVVVFVEFFAPSPRMIIFGAVDFAAALARIAHVLGHRVTVCDAREAFATRMRFPDADEVVVDWPQRLLARIGPGLTARDAICVLTHEARFDVPAIVAGLDTAVGYIGVMGSRRTHQDRLGRLRSVGVNEQGLRRLHSPIGLDLGARTPEETAVSICAELIAVRSGAPGLRSLAQSSGPIHGAL